MYLQRVSSANRNLNGPIRGSRSEAMGHWILKKKKRTAYWSERVNYSDDQLNTIMAMREVRHTLSCRLSAVGCVAQHTRFILDYFFTIWFYFYIPAVLFICLPLCIALLAYLFVCFCQNKFFCWECSVNQILTLITSTRCPMFCVRIITSILFDFFCLVRKKICFPNFS